MDALLQAVLAAPDDDAPRLAYAADLRRRRSDDPRAELIEVQIERTKLRPYSHRWQDLGGRERALIAAHAEEWTGLRWVRSFTRGFIDVLRRFAPEDVPHLRALAAREPLTAIALYDKMGPETLGALAEWLGDTPLPRLEGVLLSSEEVGLLVGRHHIFIEKRKMRRTAREIEDLRKDNWWLKDAGGLTPVFRKLPPTVRSLRLMGWDVQDSADALHEIAAPIERLALEHCNVRPDSLAPILENTRLGREVVGLGLSLNRLGEEGARTLARLAETGLPRLVELTVGSCDLGPAAVEALTTGALGRRLQHLELGPSEPPGFVAPGPIDDQYRDDRPRTQYENPLGDAVMQLCTRELPALRSLGAPVRLDSITDALVVAPFVRQLERLRLGWPALDAASLQKLVAAGVLSGLTELAFASSAGLHTWALMATIPALAKTLTSFSSWRDENVVDEAAIALAQALASVPHLETLCLPAMGAERLADFVPVLARFDALRELTLSPRSGAELAPILAALPHPLAELQVGGIATVGVHASAGAGAAVAASKHVSHLVRVALVETTTADAVALLAVPWPRLKRLDLGGEGVTDAALDAIGAATLPVLEELVLRHTAISIEGLERFEETLVRMPLLARLEILSSPALAGEPLESYDWAGGAVWRQETIADAAREVLGRLQRRVRVV